MRNNIVMLLAIFFVCAGCVTLKRDPSDLFTLYPSLSVEELSMRFTHPELYEGREDFARQNALQEILDRGIVRKGMTVQEVQTILGRPHYHQVGEGNQMLHGGVRVGESFAWSYSQLGPSELRIEFDSNGEVSRIIWHFDKPSSDYPVKDRVY